MARRARDARCPPGEPEWRARRSRRDTHAERLRFGLPGPAGRTGGRCILSGPRSRWDDSQGTDGPAWEGQAWDGDQARDDAQPWDDGQAWEAPPWGGQAWDDGQRPPDDGPQDWDQEQPPEDPQPDWDQEQPRDNRQAWDDRQFWDDETERRRWFRRRGPLIAVASSAAVLLLAGMAYAALAPGRAHPAHSAHSAPPARPVSAADRQLAALARGYLAIATPSDKQLDAEEDAYAGNERDNLAAACKNLRQEVATERLFDKQLAAITFPPALESTARALIAANRKRFRMTERQARSTTLAQLQSLDARRKAGDAAVEVQVRLLRQQLHLPPPATS
jgi:hypothetical protein